MADGCAAAQPLLRDFRSEGEFPHAKRARNFRPRPHIVARFIMRDGSRQLSANDLRLAASGASEDSSGAPAQHAQGSDASASV